MIIMTQYIYDNDLITMSNGILGEEKCSEATSFTVCCVYFGKNSKEYECRDKEKHSVTITAKQKSLQTEKILSYVKKKLITQ